MQPFKLVAVAMALLFAGLVSVIPAKAADVYANPTDIPDSAVVSNNGIDWTGFYAGLLIGYGWGDQDYDIGFFGKDTSGAEDFLSHEPKGFLFGGTIGVNYHVPDSRFVVGLEGDWSFANHDDGNSEPFGKDNTVFSETEINSIGTSRIRAGYLMNPNTLFYATGGVAWASVKTTVGAFDDQGQHQWEINAVEEDTNVGWTIGGGIEYKIDRIWSVKADYLYVDLVDTEHSLNASGGTVVSISDDLTEHMVRIGVNATLF